MPRSLLPWRWKAKATIRRRRSCIRTPATVGVACLESSIQARFGPMPTLPSAWMKMAATQKPKSCNREMIEIKNRVLGPEHPHTLLSKRSLASTLFHEHRYAEAEKLQRTTLEAERRAFGFEHPQTTNLM